MAIARAPRAPGMISRPTFLLIAFLLALAAAPPVTTPPRVHPPAESSTSGSDLAEVARRHVEILEKLAGSVEPNELAELHRLRDEAAEAREQAARAVGSPSRNEQQAALTAVQRVFEQSREALGRLASSGGHQAGAARQALARLRKLQEHARLSFEGRPGAV